MGQQNSGITNCIDTGYWILDTDFNRFYEVLKAINMQRETRNP